MTLNHKGLGRGLGSLIPNKIKLNDASDLNINTPLASFKGSRETMNSDDIQTDAAVNKDIDPAKGMHILEIEIDKIKANPYQPRNNFDHEGLEELIKSIKEHGILQPLVVSKLEDGYYELIAGERRLRASNLAGLATVPVIVREADNQKKLEWALIENIQRKNLNPVEEAIAYKRLMEEFGLTQEKTAEKTGKSLAVIANALRLLTLPEKIKNALSEGKIDKSAARAIAGLDTAEEQLNLFQELIEKGINVRKLENYVKQKKASRRGMTIPAFDAETEEKKDMLQATLGTKVSIDKKGGRGKILIDFYSDEELAEIINKICKE